LAKHDENAIQCQATVQGSLDGFSLTPNEPVICQPYISAQDGIEVFVMRARVHRFCATSSQVEENKYIYFPCEAISLIFIQTEVDIYAGQ